MLQNAYFLAKIGADTAENEQHFAEILPKTGGGFSDAGRDAGLLDVRQVFEGDFGAEIDRADQKISPFWIIKAHEVPGLFCLPALTLCVCAVHFWFHFCLSSCSWLKFRRTSLATQLNISVDRTGFRPPPRA